MTPTPYFLALRGEAGWRARGLIRNNSQLLYTASRNRYATNSIANKTMSKRGKIRSKVVQATINNKDVMEMFHGVLGTGEGTDLNIKIVHPKYLKAQEHVGRYLILLEALRDSALMGRFPAEAGHLANYVATLRARAAETFSAPDLAALHPSTEMEQMVGLAVDYAAVTKEEYEAFSAVYGRVKDSNVVNTAIVTCNNLVPHKKSLDCATALRDRFLTRTAGLSFAPLPGLPAMNFKQIYISDLITQADKQFLLMVLHKMLAISHDVYETMSSPDIDVNEFVQVIISSLDDVKKHIPRCDEAFDKIRESVGLLKGNFGGYYKDFVASNNPTIIMENFVLDVSKSTNSSPKVTAQFRRIIGHYRKLASQQAQHPQMKSLFAQVDKNFQELEKRSRQADDGGAGGDDDAAESDASDDESGASGNDSVDEEKGGAPLSKEERDAGRRQQKNRKKRDRLRRKKAGQMLEDAMDAASAAAAAGTEPAAPAAEPAAATESAGGLGEELDDLSLGGAPE
jgi:hypothetical protein